MKSNDNIRSLKQILDEKKLTLVFSSESCYVESESRGVKPLLEILDSGKNTVGGIAADKVVGKAAAFLYVLLGVREIYANVISQPAIEIFEKYGIKVSYGNSVPGIINRKGDGPCPMESAVGNESSPENALILIRKKLSELSASI